MKYNICLCCNKLISNEDLLNHLQQNKDHVNFCYKVDDLKKLLADINNTSTLNNNNNIFKIRIETIWSELKRLSNSHKQLTENLNDVTNLFKLMYDYLMSQEHSLKKPIQDDIKLINDNIINQIKELKSIVKIINLNNKLNNNTNNNSSDYSNHIIKDIDLDDFEYIPDKYSTSTFIDLILQSDSIYNFIDTNNILFDENNNNIKDYKYNNLSFLNYIEYFNRQFNSCLVNPTKLDSQSIKIIKNHYIVNSNFVSDKLENLIKNSINVYKSPSVFVHFGDFEGLKEYYKQNNIIKLEYNHKSYKSKQQTETIEIIIEILKSNRVDILEYLIQELQFDINTNFILDDHHLTYFHNTKLVDLLSIATIYSILQTIQYIETLGINNNITWNYKISLELSPYSNNIEILKYFSSKIIEKGLNSLDDIFVSAYAALLGNLDMIEWISQSTPFLFIFKISNGIQYSINFASFAGHFDIVKWLHDNRSEGCTTKAMENAAMNGHLEIIKWLHENRSEGCTNNAMDVAVINGHLETIKWLHENRREGCTTYAMDYASKNGHFEIIKWLHENRTEGCTTKAMDYAAENGHLETIKWLHHNRTEGCTTDAMNYAARNRNLEIITWLLENRTEGSTSDLAKYASENGNLEMIKWLHHNRTDGISTNTMDNAAMKGNLEIIKWLHENRTEGCTTKAMDFAASKGNLEIIKWLCENRTEGCTTNAMDDAASKRHLEIIKWLHENRTEGCTIKAMDFALKNEHLEMIKWLHHNRTEGCITDVMIYAAKNGSVEIFKWIQQNISYDAKNNTLKKKQLEINNGLNEIKTSQMDKSENKAKSNSFLKVFEWFKN